MEKIVRIIPSGRQRRSLGARKSGESRNSPRKGVRTSVVLPGDVDWPDVDETAEKEILYTIERDLKCLSIPKRKCSLKDLASVTKEERAEVRKRVIAEQNLNVGYDITTFFSKRQQLCIGVNICSMYMDDDMEGESLVGLIIEKEVDPQIITKLLVPIALNKRIPVISIFGLREAVKKACGIKCIALGFKRQCLSYGSDFRSLAQLVLDHGVQRPEKELKKATISPPLKCPSPSLSSESGAGTFSLKRELERLEKKKEVERKAREIFGPPFAEYITPKMRRLEVLEPNNKS